MAFPDDGSRMVPGAHYCPECGDAANVFAEQGVFPRFVCRRGHRGAWVANRPSGRPAEWTMPSGEEVERWTKRMGERGRHGD